MNYNLPILSAAIGLAIVVLVTSTQSSQTDEQKGFGRSEQTPTDVESTQPPISTRTGQELIADAGRRLLFVPGLEAKTRQSVNIFGQKLVGSGTYRQLTDGPKLLIDLDLKLQVGDEKRILRQVSDGESLWEIRGKGESQTTSHVNLGRLREVAYETKVPPSLWMAMGGIPHLMARLEENFAFQTPVPATIGQHPVWTVQGQWKPMVLARMLPGQKEAILSGKPARLRDLPEQVPHGVTLVLGRDRIIPDFPYSFSFYRDEVVDEETGETARTAVVTWELFEVRIRPDLNRSRFDYRPSDQKIHERTDYYVDRLKAAAKESDKESAKR